MKGCALVGKVVFQDGVVPDPVWPPGGEPAHRASRGEESEPA